MIDFKKRKHGYVKADNYIRDVIIDDCKEYPSIVSGAIYTLYLIVLSYRNHSTGICCPSLSTLEEDSCYPFETILEYLKILFQIGALDLEYDTPTASSYYSFPMESSYDGYSGSERIGELKDYATNINREIEGCLPIPGDNEHTYYRCLNVYDYQYMTLDSDEKNQYLDHPYSFSMQNTQDYSDQLWEDCADKIFTPREMDSRWRKHLEDKSNSAPENSAPEVDDDYCIRGTMF